MGHVLISQLAIGDTNNKICARVSRLWNFYDLNDETKLLHTDLVLLDEVGNSIHAQIYPPATEKHNPVLQEENVYYIDSYSVKRANRTYRPVSNDLMILFSKWTKLEQCTQFADDFPGITFSLTPFQEIPSLVDRLYVMGIITEIGSTCLVRPKSRNTDSLKKTLQIRNGSGSSLPVTLWGERASAFDGDKIYADGQTEPQVAVFVGTLVRDYRDIGLTLTGSSPCKWYINLDMAEVAEMKKSFAVSFRPIKWVEASGPGYSSNPPEQKTVEQILALNPHKSMHLRFIVNITIRKICNEAGWWYYACSKCYKVVVLAGDGTKDAQFVLFGKVAQRVIRKSVETLIDQNPHAKDFIPDEITALLEQDFVWNISFAKNSMTRSKRDVETFEVNSIISSPGSDQPHLLMAPPGPDTSTEIIPFSPTSSTHTPPASTESALGSLASSQGKSTTSLSQSSSTLAKQTVTSANDQTPTSKYLAHPSIKKKFVLSVKPTLPCSSQVSSKTTQEQQQIENEPAPIAAAATTEEKPTGPAIKEDEIPSIDLPVSTKAIGKKRATATSSAPVAKKLFKEPTKQDETDSA